MGKPKKRKKRINTNKPLSERMFVNLVDKIVKRHGQVRIVSSDEEPTCDCLCASCKKEKLGNYDVDFRMRQISKDGNCKVSYYGDGYGRNFSQSCFIDRYYDDNDCGCDWTDDCVCIPKKTVKKTVRYLLEHDDSEMAPVELRYGKRFSIKKKIKLKQTW